MDATGEVVRGVAIGAFQPSRERLEQLGAWFQTEYPALLRFAYFVSGDPGVAEDLVQDAFVKMYRAGGRASRTGIKTYARTTILNLSRSRAVRRTDAVVAPSDVAPPDLGARDEMWRALLTLSPRQRACVALRFYEDMKERDIADALGMSVGAVKKHTDRALTKLREVLGRQS
jgi:RNA polymerase sigma factor (sigma-70 family)